MSRPVRMAKEKSEQRMATRVVGRCVDVVEFMNPLPDSEDDDAAAGFEDVDVADVKEKALLIGVSPMTPSEGEEVEDESGAVTVLKCAIVSQTNSIIQIVFCAYYVSMLYLRPPHL